MKNDLGPVERNEIHSVIEIHVAGAGNKDKFLWLGRPLVGIFAEFPGVSMVAADEEHRIEEKLSRFIERVEVHELDVAGQRRLCGELRRAVYGRVFTARRAVEVIELTLDSRSLQSVHAPFRRCTRFRHC